MGYRDAMGTSAPNADSGVTDRAELERLAEEQSALRRVATLVAQGASSTEVFGAVAQEVVQVLHLSNAAICRLDDEGSTMTVVAVWGDHPEIVRPGSRWPLDGPSMTTEILRTGRPARLEDYSDLPGVSRHRSPSGRGQQCRGCPDHRRRPSLGSDLDVVTARAAP